MDKLFQNSSSESITIQIINQAGTINQLNVQLKNTIQEVKANYQNISGIDPHLQKLYYKEQELYNNKATLQKLNIKNFDTIICQNSQISNINNTYDKYYITIRDQIPKLHRIECEPNSKVQDVMKIIHLQTGIPSDQQRLIFGGKQLEDERSILEYGVKCGSVVHLVLRLRGC